MKRLLDVLKGVCSIAAAIVVYITVIKATGGTKDILPYVVASVFAVAFAVSLFPLASLVARVETLEELILDDEETQPDSDSDEEFVLPSEKPGVGAEAKEYFATDDPDYKGTDFSGEDPISANTDSEDGENFGEKHEN